MEKPAPNVTFIVPSVNLGNPIKARSAVSLSLDGAASSSAFIHRRVSNASMHTTRRPRSATISRTEQHPVPPLPSRHFSSSSVAPPPPPVPARSPRRTASIHNSYKPKHRAPSVYSFYDDPEDEMLEEFFPGARRIVIQPGSPPPPPTEDLFPVIEDEYQSYIPSVEDVPGLIFQSSLLLEQQDDNRFSVGSSTDASDGLPRTPKALTEESEPSVYDDPIETSVHDHPTASSIHTSPAMSNKQDDDFAPTPPPTVAATKTIKSLHREAYLVPVDSSADSKKWKVTLGIEKPVKKQTKPWLQNLKFWK